MDPKQQNGREKSSSLTAPGRLERSSNQSYEHSSNANLSSTDKSDGRMNEECGSEANLLIKVIEFAVCFALLCNCAIDDASFINNRSLVACINQRNPIVCVFIVGKLLVENMMFDLMF